MSFDVVHDNGGLPRGQRRAAGRDGCRLSPRDRERWVLVRVGRLRMRWLLEMPPSAAVRASCGAPGLPAG